LACVPGHEVLGVDHTPLSALTRPGHARVPGQLAAIARVERKAHALATESGMLGTSIETDGAVVTYVSNWITSSLHVVVLVISQY